jgi:hypothetical protein
MMISPAFLAPKLIEAAVESRPPHGVGVARLFDAPVVWARQGAIGPMPKLLSRLPNAIRWSRPRNARQ